MTRGKKGAQSAARRAAVSEDVLREARELRLEAAARLAEQEVRHRAEMHALHLEHLANIEALADERVQQEREMVGARAEEIASARRSEYRIETLLKIGEWWATVHVNTSLSKFFELFSSLDLTREEDAAFWRAMDFDGDQASPRDVRRGYYTNLRRALSRAEGDRGERRELVGLQ